MIEKIRIASRKSPLALWQAEFVKSKLASIFPHTNIEIKGFSTKGDRFLETSLSKIGGKGLFIKELEAALQNDEADIAVHSMKDLPPSLPDEFLLAAVLERHDPSDAFISNNYDALELLQPEAVIGTSSVRRQSQLLSRFPGVKIKVLRGNVNTRLEKLDAGLFDAIILATAGLKRLGFDKRISQRIPHEICLPSAGQGALGIECKKDDINLIKMISKLNHEFSATCVEVEKKFLSFFDGGCSLPIACYAHLFNENKMIKCEGLVASCDGKSILRSEVIASYSDAKGLGQKLSDNLINMGALEILENINGNTRDRE